MRDLKNALLAFSILTSAPVMSMEKVPSAPQEFTATFFHLPGELKRKILHMNANADGVLNIPELAREICSLSWTNKGLRRSMNNSLMGILQLLPTNAASLYLASKLSALPGMQREDIQTWLGRLRLDLKLERWRSLRGEIVFAKDLQTITALLCNKNIDVNDTDKIDKTTPLMYAMSCFRDQTFAIFKLLLDAGADPDLQDTGGRTALIRVAYVREKDFEETYHIQLYANAAERYKAHARQRELADLLLKAGANPDIKNNAGETAYDLALEENNTQVAELLAIASAERRARLAQRASSKRKH